ncbi:MAG TPA: hypothetical protein VMX54_06930 [Vicinamibacteria bacterium]|nr:hypothetical protein [Vicinamibacteria bacterium]
MPAATVPSAPVSVCHASARSRRRVLFIGGSLNQTSMLRAVARELSEQHCVFTPYYADGGLRWAAERGLLDFTILGGRPRQMSEAFLRENEVEIDERGAGGTPDLVVTSTDLLVQRNLRGRPMVLVQEGMMDPEDWRYRLVRGLRLPRWLANTSMTGLSHAYQSFCVASSGYADVFVRKGIPPERIEVTGLPNFDDCASFLRNDFPHRGYVLAATSCLRETLKREDRRGFIRRCLAIADGRPLVFKLHPNEDHPRARREIERETKQALVFDSGNTNHMIANCDVLVTRYSSVVFVAQALGKEIHCDLDTLALRRLTPIQNGGTSARRIADVCRRLLS